jgi:hypothetical protein
MHVLFAQADVNHDGKLTKEEITDFIWKQLSKADANKDNAVTKEELRDFARKQVQDRLAERHRPHPRHRGAKANGPKQEAAPATGKPEEKPAAKKPEAEKPKEAPPATKTEVAPKPETQSTSKLEKPKATTAGTSAT